MQFITRLFGIPLGFIMWAIYSVIPNYGIALLIFTILTRLILFPMAIKQQKTSARMTGIQPQVAELQKKYASDRVRLQEETQKLYTRENVSPTAGCLPMLVQMPILFGLIDVIYRPLTHILRLPKELIAKATKLFGLFGKSISNSSMMELEIITTARQNPLFFGLLGATALNQIHTINYSFLGMNLMTRPSMSMITGIFSGGFDPVIFIPIISGVTSLFMSLITTRNTAPAGGGTDQTAGMMKGMMLTMPLMSVWIAFTVPAGVGLYWVYSNICGILQGLYMNKFHNPKDLQAAIQKERDERKEDERQERLEAKRQLKEGLLGKENADKAMTQKEIDRLKLAQARKRDADKYGELYSDDEE